MSADLQGFYLTVVSDAGVVVFAASGAIVAAQKRMDLFGATSLAVATAMGGGTLRDLLIGQVPVFWVSDQIPFWIAAATGVIVFLLRPAFPFSPRTLLIPDAIGLALFTWLGCEKTFLLGLSSTAILLMGVITGTAGGIIRDVLSGNVPGVFMKGELYATASCAGALAFLILLWLGAGEYWMGIVCAAMVLIIRLAAIRWKICLPEYRGAVGE